MHGQGEDLSAQRLCYRQGSFALTMDAIGRLQVHGQGVVDLCGNAPFAHICLDDVANGQLDDILRPGIVEDLIQLIDTYENITGSNSLPGGKSL